jgi:MoaA/NifB/PqqE/SkfB family radical SAM enzyme
MDAEAIAAYDATRDFSQKSFRSICYAPFASMYLDTVGQVRACCQNTRYLLGDLKKERLADIWNGPRTRALRSALKRDKLSLGCEFCAWQLADGNPQTVFAKYFESYPVADDHPAWPQQIEFSISNTCNLECVMCTGEYSSSIRARRERLPPLPKPYGEQFFEDLRPFLPHLKLARFLGGEPFLAKEPLRIYEMMIEDGLEIPCHVTTNGTQYNEAVERILQHLPVSFAVSMDGVTKETVESIRVNADHQTLLANFERFHAYTRRRGTSISLTYCLMRQNWREFGDYLLFGDAWDCDVSVNTVQSPSFCSLYSLSTDELSQVVAGLESQAGRVEPQLKRNLPVWLATLDRLRHRLQHLGRNYVQRTMFAEVQLLSDARVTDAAAETQRRLLEWADGPVDQIVCDQDDLIVEVICGGESIGEGSFLGVPRERILGRPISDMTAQLAHLYGRRLEEISVQDGELGRDRVVKFVADQGDETLVRAIHAPRLNAQGQAVGSTTTAALRLPAGQRI